MAEHQRPDEAGQVADELHQPRGKAAAGVNEGHCHQQHQHDKVEHDGRVHPITPFGFGFCRAFQAAGPSSGWVSRSAWPPVTTTSCFASSTARGFVCVGISH